MAFGAKKDRQHYQKKPEMPRGLDAPPYFEHGEMLDCRYKVDSILGRGGFGQVFQAKDMVSKQYVAIKVEPRDRHTQINTERMVLLDLASCRHVPDMLDCGYTNDFCFLVLPVYSDNLFELRKFSKDLRFPVKFSLGIFYQLVETLEEIHKIGYVHRDIKPSNFCLGRLPNERSKVFLIDFGMSRRFRSLDGKLIERRDNVPFRGTSRYCSKRVHLRYDQGPCDDMCSLLFGIIEMMEGDLPWKGDENDRMLATIKAKPIFKFDKFTKFTPIPLFHIAHYVQQCTYEHELRYDIIKKHINESLRWLLENEDINEEKREIQVKQFMEDFVKSDRKKVTSVADNYPPFPATQSSINAPILADPSKVSIIQRQENRKVEYDWVKPPSRDIRRNTRNESFYVQTVRNELDEARRNFVMNNISSDQKMASPVEEEPKGSRNGSAMEVQSYNTVRNGHGDQQRAGSDRQPQESPNSQMNKENQSPQSPEPRGFQRSNHFSKGYSRRAENSDWRAPQRHEGRSNVPNWRAEDNGPGNSFNGNNHQDQHQNQRNVENQERNEDWPRRHSEWNQGRGGGDQEVPKSPLFKSDRSNFQRLNSCNDSQKPPEYGAGPRNRWSQMERRAYQRGSQRPQKPFVKYLFVPHNIEGLDE